MPALDFNSRFGLIGEELLLYWDSDDDWASPNWVLEEDRQDINFNPSRVMVDIPRASGKVARAGRTDWALSFTLNCSPSDNFFVAVLDAIATGGCLHLALADAAIATAGAKYWHADWVLRGPLSGQLDTAASLAVECMVAAQSSNAPALVTVAGA